MIDRNPIESRELLNEEIHDFINKNAPGCNRGHSAVKPQEQTVSVSSKVITVTPDQARKFLAKMVHNRPVSVSSVNRYAKEIAAGNWCLNGQGIIFDAEGRLLDGQHRCHAIIKAGIPVQILAIYGVADATFSRMDVGNKRSAADVITTKNRYSVAAALKYLHREVVGDGAWWNTNIRLSPYDGVSVFEKFSGIEDAGCLAMANKGAQKFIACGNLTYCLFRAKMESEADCATFLSALNTGAEIGARSPILSLRNALMPSSGVAYKNEHQIALFILAWKIFLARGQSKFLRLPNEMPKWSVSL